ncbi:MAG TPA: N-acetyltransferase [Clostridiales bacterium]|nr:N-acetyltransferase [Clostridiales bacterium]
MIQLRKIDAANLWPVVNLSVNEDQKGFVATNTKSILQAYVTITAGQVALPFAIYNDDYLVGLVMLGYGTVACEDDPAIAKDNYCIWRLMIDKNYQGQGFGKDAITASLDFIRTWPCGKAEYCWLSYEPENERARKLYAAMGFIENGEIVDDEIIAVLKL